MRASDIPRLSGAMGNVLRKAEGTVLPDNGGTIGEKLRLDPDALVAPGGKGARSFERKVGKATYKLYEAAWNLETLLQMPPGAPPVLAGNVPPPAESALAAVPADAAAAMQKGDTVGTAKEDLPLVLVSPVKLREKKHAVFKMNWGPLKQAIWQAIESSTLLRIMWNVYALTWFLLCTWALPLLIGIVLASGLLMATLIFVRPEWLVDELVRAIFAGLLVGPLWGWKVIKSFGASAANELGLSYWLDTWLLGTAPSANATSGPTQPSPAPPTQLTLPLLTAAAGWWAAARNRQQR